MRHVYILVLLLIIFASCNSKSINKTETNAKYSIVFDDNTDSVDVRDIISDIQIIELDTVKEALMPFISNIQLCNDRIYCMGSGGVKVYSLTGKFLFDMTHLGHANNEWVHLSSMFVNPKNGTITFVDMMSQKILVYDLDNHFLKSYKVGAYDIHGAVFDDKLLYSMRDPVQSVNFQESEETDYNIVVYDENSKILCKLINTQNQLGMDVSTTYGRRFCNGEDGLLFSNTLYDTIYLIKGKNVYPYASYNYKGTQISFYTEDELREQLERKEVFLKKGFYSCGVVESPQYIIRRLGMDNAYDIIFDKTANKTYLTKFDNRLLSGYHLSELYIYPSPLEYYKGCYYAPIILQYFTSFPEEDYKDYIPEQLKPYIDRIRNGQVNNLIVSYKIDINK